MSTQKRRPAPPSSSGSEAEVEEDNQARADHLVTEGLTEDLNTGDDNGDGDGGDGNDAPVAEAAAVVEDDGLLTSPSMGPRPVLPSEQV